MTASRRITVTSLAALLDAINQVESKQDSSSVSALMEEPGFVAVPPAPKRTVEGGADPCRFARGGEMTWF